MLVQYFWSVHAKHVEKLWWAFGEALISARRTCAMSSLTLVTACALTSASARACSARAVARAALLSAWACSIWECSVTIPSPTHVSKTLGVFQQPGADQECPNLLLLPASLSIEPDKSLQP